MRPHRPNPYCIFKDDDQRRRALRSRDVRLAVIAIVTVLLSGSVVNADRWQHVLAWARRIVG